MTNNDIKHAIGSFLFWLLKKICDKIVKKYHLNLSQFLSVISSIFVIEKSKLTLLEKNEKEVLNNENK